MSRGLVLLFPTSSEKDMHKSNIGHLVGGFNPVETYARQIGSFPQGSG